MAAAINPSRGEKHYNAKLSEEDVRLIKQLIHQRRTLMQQLARVSNKAIAEKFEVSTRTIDKISEGYSWIHI